MKFEKKEIAGHAFYVAKDPNQPSICIAGPRMIFLGPRKLLAERVGMPALRRGPLAESLKRAEESQATIFAAVQLPKSPEGADLTAKLCETLNSMSPAAESLVDMRSGSLEASEEKGLHFAVELRYADPETANRANEAIAALVKVAHAQLAEAEREFGSVPVFQSPIRLAKAALASIKPALRAETLQVSVSIDATVTDLLKIGNSFAQLAPPSRKATIRDQDDASDSKKTPRKAN